jgi:hypothetical protein
MSNSRPKSLSKLISSQDSRIGQLAQEARSRLELADHIRTGLPPELSAELTACALDANQTLIVRASNPAWAARLRFESERLLDLCRQRHPQTRSVKVKVTRQGN